MRSVDEADENDEADGNNFDENGLLSTDIDALRLKKLAVFDPDLGSTSITFLRI